jgi:hypothetical protein
VRSKASPSDLARALAKRNSATSSSQEVVRSKASSSDLARALAKLRMSKRTEHQRPSGQRPTGTKFSQEIARATSSSFSGRDTRGQRKYDPLLRTQGRHLRGGADPEESSEQQGESNKRQKIDDATDEELGRFDMLLQDVRNYNEKSKNCLRNMRSKERPKDK